MKILRGIGIVSLALLAWRPLAAASRFEPPAGRTLLIMGQNLEDIEATLVASHMVPGALMSYTSVHQVEGLSDAYNQGNGTQYAQKLVNRYPYSALQIGLWMVGDCPAIAQGQLDQEIERLGKWLKKTQRPIFLRVGYEFDNPQNHYPPKEYVEAYRHLVDRLRVQGVQNVAFVWHSYAGPQSVPLNEYYPGDEFVDWVGISYFEQPQGFMQPMVQFAKTHGKPVMIAESSPWHIQTKSSNSWNLWFAPLFKFIAANDIKAFSYISCDWDSTDQFKDQRWGDARLQSNLNLMKRWQEEVGHDRYIKASRNLFKVLGYTN